MIEVNGQSVCFADGSVEEVDAIIFGTGYDLNLPFLSELSGTHLISTPFTPIACETMSPSVPLLFSAHPEQCSQLQALAKARNDPAFGLLVNQLTTASKRPFQRFNLAA
jgi:hypothetical protein